MKQLFHCLLIITTQFACKNSQHDRVNQGTNRGAFSKKTSIECSLNEVVSVVMDSTDRNSKYYVWCLLEMKSKEKIFLSDYVNFRLSFLDGEASRGAYDQIPPPVNFYDKAMSSLRPENRHTEVIYYSNKTQSNQLNYEFKNHILEKLKNKFEANNEKNHYDSIYKDQFKTYIQGVTFMNTTDTIKTMIYLGIFDKGKGSFILTYEPDNSDNMIEKELGKTYPRLFGGYQLQKKNITLDTIRFEVK